jgi:DNA-binding beta-propeller fold protein YncE
MLATPGLKAFGSGVAVSRDGSTLVVADCFGGSRSVHEFSVTDGSPRRVTGGFDYPYQVCVAPDGCLFIADTGSNTVRVMSPGGGSLRLWSVSEPLCRPTGVCVNDDIVVVAESTARLHRVSVFSRLGAVEGTLLCRFGEGVLKSPLGLCFMSGNTVAVVDNGRNRVSVYRLHLRATPAATGASRISGVDAELERDVGVGVLSLPQGAACTDADELVVADWGNRCVRLFDAAGSLLHTLGRGYFAGVALHGRTLFAQEHYARACVVLSLPDPGPVAGTAAAASTETA